MATAKKKTQRRTSPEDVLAYIKESIEDSDDRIFEASLIDMGDYFGVESATMNYHMKKLEEQGEIKLIDNEGRYRRKRYVLQEDYELLVGLGSKEEFIKHMKDTTKEHNPIKQDVSQSDTEYLVPIPKKEEAVIDTASRGIEDYTFKNPTKDEVVIEDKIEEELTLDDQIERFLEQAKKYDEANILLEQNDKDILAVLNETLQQNMVYLKDLSDQLSSMETKRLFLALIDEKERLEKENKDLQEKADRVSAENNDLKVSPERVRQMQQIIISSVDNYINLPNHSMALQRREFRENIFKEVKDLVDYVLRLER